MICILFHCLDFTLNRSRKIDVATALTANKNSCQPIAWDAAANRKP